MNYSVEVELISGTLLYVDVILTCKGFFMPGKFHGLPENCYPCESDFYISGIELVSMHMTKASGEPLFSDYQNYKSFFRFFFDLYADEIRAEIETDDSIYCQWCDYIADEQTAALI